MIVLLKLKMKKLICLYDICARLFGASIQYESDMKTVSVKTNAIVLDESVKRYFENVQVFD